ncbi:DoxX family protein [Phyllobacterium sp. 628]|uniref:DoxX family protein n=1 Tax=Phyllobacterium sp. 628 TaxID=2718938 RepID=UPI00353045DC
MKLNGNQKLATLRAALRWFLALIYCAAGILHILRPQWFMQITPAWVPYPLQVILLTGVCEVLGGLALLGQRFRKAAGFALALYAVCVYPANIKHAIDSLSAANVTLGWCYHAPRLAFQPVLVWWALFAGENINWPFNRRVE